MQTRSRPVFLQPCDLKQTSTESFFKFENLRFLSAVHVPRCAIQPELCTGAMPTTTESKQQTLTEQEEGLY